MRGKELGAGSGGWPHPEAAFDLSTERESEQDHRRLHHRGGRAGLGPYHFFRPLLRSKEDVNLPEPRNGCFEQVAERLHYLRPKPPPWAAVSARFAGFLAALAWKEGDLGPPRSRVTTGGGGPGHGARCGDREDRQRRPANQRLFQRVSSRADGPARPKPDPARARADGQAAVVSRHTPVAAGAGARREPIRKGPPAKSVDGGPSHGD